MQNYLLLIISLIYLFILIYNILIWKNIFLFLFGIIYFLLLALSLRGCEKIISNYCERKKINNNNIYNNKNIILYSFILFIIPFYIIFLKWRLFIILSNFYVFFLVDLPDKEYKSLSIYIIIFILFISTLLIWTDLINKKNKTGKYSLYSLFVGIFIFLSLIFSIIISITGRGINYLFILNVLGQLSIIGEIFSILIEGDLVQFSFLENQILPNLNFRWISIKWGEYKNYINLNKLKINNLNINEKYGIKNKEYRFHINKSLYNKSINSGNIMMRMLNRLFAFFLYVSEITWKSQYLCFFKNGVNNGIKWGFKLSVGGLNAIEPVNLTSNKNELLSYWDKLNNLNVINVNINITGTGIDTRTGNGSSNSSIDKTKNELSDVGNSLSSNDNSNKRSFSSIEDDKNKKEEVQSREKKKLRSLRSDIVIESNIKSRVRYPDGSIKNIKDICKDVHNDESVKIGLKNKSLNVSNKSSVIFDDLIGLPYSSRCKMNKIEIVNQVFNYLSLNKYTQGKIQSRFIVLDFLNMWQTEVLTRATEILIEKPAETALLCSPEDRKWTDLGNYPYVKSVYFHEKRGEFNQGLTKVPIDIERDINFLFEYLRKHFYVLDNNLNCRSLNMFIKDDLKIEGPSFRNDYNILVNTAQNIKMFTMKKIYIAFENKSISLKEKGIYVEYCNSCFNEFIYLLKIRYFFLQPIFVSGIISEVDTKYIAENLINCNYARKEVINPFDEKGLNTLRIKYKIGNSNNVSESNDSSNVVVNKYYPYLTNKKINK